MATKVFINLPVKDLKKSMNFFSELGYSFNPQFTDEKAACMVINEGRIYAMLITEPFFQTFTKKKIADAQTSTEVLIALDAGSKEEVDETVRKAVAAGGSVYRAPEDHGWMYGHSFADPDGHQWEVLYMDEAGMAGNPQQQALSEPNVSIQ
jgi:predicted lactoylglutathione lyase